MSNTPENESTRPKQKPGGTQDSKMDLDKDASKELIKEESPKKSSADTDTLKKGPTNKKSKAIESNGSNGSNGSTGSTGRTESKGKSRINLFSFSLNIVFIAALLYLGMMLFEHEKSFDLLFSEYNQSIEQQALVATELVELQQNSQELELLLDESSELLNSQRTQVEALTSDLGDYNNELQRLNRELIITRQQVSVSDASISQEWYLIEAESLLQIAQQELLISGDIASAIALYIASDEALKQINDVNIISIREMLASELASLRAVPEIDIQAIYLQLNELQNRLQFFQVISGAEQQVAASRELVTLQVEGETEEVSILNSLLDKMSEYIVIKRRDQVIQPLLSIEQQSYLKQNVLLQLQQANLALLDNKEVIYRASLEQVIETTEQYLVAEGSEKQSVISALRTLQTADIVVTIPALTNTINALRQTLLQSSLQGRVEP